MNANNDNEMGLELSAYLDGELSTADAAKVENALSESPELVKQLEQLKATRGMLRGLSKVAAPEGFAARVITAAENNKHTSPHKRFSGWYWGSAVAAAVIIAAVAVGYPLLVQRQSEGDETSVAKQDQAKKLGEIARDMKSDSKLSSHRREKKDSSLKRISELRSVGVPMVGDLPMSSTENLGMAKKGMPGSGRERLRDNYVYHDDRRGGKQLLIAGKLDEKSVLELAAANRYSNNKDIWTDNIEAEQANVEKVLANNGLQVVPKTQAVLEPNQVMNLSSNLGYNAKLNRAVEAKPREIEYLVYGTPEQVAKVTKELRGKVQTRQRVSQLSEKEYRGAIVANARGRAVDEFAEQNESLAKKRVFDKYDKLKTPEETSALNFSDGLADEKKPGDIAKSTARGAEDKSKSRLELSRLGSRVKKNAPVKSVPVMKPVQAKPKAEAQDLSETLEAKPQQAAAVMITLRYRAPEPLNPKQEEAITNLELQNSLPLSQRRLRASGLAGKGKAAKSDSSTSQPTKPTTTAPSSQPAAK
ncbi:MAG: zf-HC2 domain-containing protein [Phycisphaerae bacterium]|nr:zf-HC2 domain-containing protein [Phycisphaerae bacterium]